MTSQSNPSDIPVGDGAAGVRSSNIAQMIANVYQDAATGQRLQLIERLMQPLGLLAVVTVAHGAFARIWFRRGWQDLTVRVEDLRMVGFQDVLALARFVEESSMDTIDSLIQMLASWPTLASSSAVLVLVAALVRRAALRHTEAGANPAAGGSVR